MGIRTEERQMDLTELYIADEVFACGTSAFVAPVTEIDAREIGDGGIGRITARLRATHWPSSTGGPGYERMLIRL
jgi:branched-chain amino acid aminotransferase